MRRGSTTQGTTTINAPISPPCIVGEDEQNIGLWLWFFLGIWFGIGGGLSISNSDIIAAAIAIYSFMVFLFPILSDSIFNVMCNQAIALIYVTQNIFLYLLVLDSSDHSMFLVCCASIKIYMAIYARI